MTRLRFQLKESEADHRAAASRIDDARVVEEDADALITDEAGLIQEGVPTLLLGDTDANAFPALPWRFSPQAQSIRSSLDDGQLGTPGLLRLHHWHPGAITMDTQIAAIDLALWLFDATPDATHHAISAGNRLFHLGFPGGGMAMIDFSSIPAEGEGYHSLSLIGSRGAAYADDHRDRNLIFTGGVANAELPGCKNAFIQPMLEDFLASVIAGKAPEKANNDYLAAQKIVEEAGDTPGP
jgi:predicted dehydrogenase